MAIKYKHGAEWEQPLYINEIIQFIKYHKEYFLVLASILSNYRTPDADRSIAAERREDLSDLIDTKDGLLDRSTEEIERFKRLVEDLYEEKSERLHATRGKILEAIVYNFGPYTFSINCNTQRYNEPQIFDEEVLVGFSNHVIDIIFHENGIKVIKADYIECKASIHSFVDLRRAPLRMSSRDKRKKWKYIKDVYEYLVQNHFTPQIYIACFTSDVSDYQQKLKDTKFEFVRILNDEELFNMIS